MNFLFRLFRRASPVVEQPKTAAAPAVAAQPPVRPVPVQMPAPEDMTLIDPVAKDAWQAGAARAKNRHADKR